MLIKIDPALWSSPDTVWLVETQALNGGAKNEMIPLVRSGAWACPAFPSPEPVGGQLLPLPLGTASSLAHSI